MGKIKRLLQLQPDHPRAVELAGRISDGVFRLATQRLTEGKPDEAVKLLERIPGVARTKETEALRLRARELGRLSWDLFHAPVVDHALVAVAARLKEIAPENRKFTDLHAELQLRVKKTTIDDVLRPVPWARAPKKTRFGCDVDWVTRFENVKVAEGVDGSVLDHHPGCFFVALGLALHMLSPTSRQRQGTVVQQSRTGGGIARSRSASGDLLSRYCRFYRIGWGQPDSLWSLSQSFALVQAPLDLGDHRFILLTACAAILRFQPSVCDPFW